MSDVDEIMSLRPGASSQVVSISVGLGGSGNTI